MLCHAVLLSESDELFRPEKVSLQDKTAHSYGMRTGLASEGKVHSLLKITSSNKSQRVPHSWRHCESLEQSEW